MNTSDRPARLFVGKLHHVPKNGRLGLDLVGFLHGVPDRDGIGVGMVANIHLMQERPSRRSWPAGIQRANEFDGAAGPRGDFIHPGHDLDRSGPPSVGTMRP
ncbi:MAG: hypothetical protein ACRDGI_08540, partial [Candidatus Limnocylindrales bacterium]